MDFFIGWDRKSGETSVKRSRFAVLIISLLAVFLVGIVAALQATIGKGFFDFGHTQEFNGLFISKPYPMLLSEKPIEGHSTILLVNEWKFGLSNEVSESFHLKSVKVKGTLINDEHQAMIEVVNEGIIPDEAFSTSDIIDNRVENIGTRTLSGEIVDSKCWLGVMNPGSRKTHRACAILCIKGGIPPILVSQTSEENPSGYYLLVGTDGSPINEQILDYVGLPAQVEGQVKKIAGLFVMRIDPSSIQLLE